MSRFTALVIAAVVGSAFAASADAADLRRRPPPPPPVEEVRPIAVVASGWYLRGDVGYRWNTVSRVDVATGFSAPSENHISGGFVGGIGAGFKQDALRVDVTLDYGSPVTYRGTVVTADDMTAKIQASTALVNLYYEPYTWGQLTPYIGAGVGAAYVRVSDYSSTVVPPFTPVEGTKKLDLAYALMAGTAFTLSHHLVFDLGYRYLNLGTADTSNDSAGRIVQFKNIAAHEVRFGVRWMFPDPVKFY